MTLHNSLRIIILIILSLFCTVLFFLFTESITDYLNETGHQWLSLISNTLLAVLIFLFVWWFNKKVNRLKPEDYGFNAGLFVRNFLTGIFFCVLISSSTLIVALFFNAPIEFVPLIDNYSFALAEFVLANLVVAVWEESYFRGLVVNILLQHNISFKWTAVISSAFFTAVHFGSYDLEQTTPYWILAVFLLSLILLYLYVLTQSIWTSIGFHFFWDSIFLSLDTSENEFGLIRMESYSQNSILIDNISIVILIIFIGAFLMVKGRRIAPGVTGYLRKIKGSGL